MPSSKLAKNRELDVTLLEQAICLPQLSVRYIFEIHMICTLWHLQEYGTVICLMDTRRLSNELSLKTNFVTLDNGLVPKANNLLIEQRNEILSSDGFVFHQWPTFVPFHYIWQYLLLTKFVFWQVCSFDGLLRVATGMAEKYSPTFPWQFPDCQHKFQSLSRYISCGDFLQYIQNHIEISSFINRCFNIVVLEIGQHKRTFSTSWKVSISGISPTFP